MTEPTARPELPEGPWNYDYHGDWSTYAMGLPSRALHGEVNGKVLLHPRPRDARGLS